MSVNQGETNALAVLTEANVVALREAVAAGQKQKDLAAVYGLHPTHVSMIVTGRRWAHAPGPLKTPRSGPRRG